MSLKVCERNGLKWRYHGYQSEASVRSMISRGADMAVSTGEGGSQLRSLEVCERGAAVAGCKQPRIRIFQSALLDSDL